MADAVWPVGLPTAPLVASYSQVDTDRVIRSSMETGPAKVRLRTTAIIETCSVELKMTRLQVAILLSFYRETCLGGAAAFQWRHHQTGNLIDYRFTGPPECRPLAPRQSGSEYWAVGFRLETVPGTEITSTDPPASPVNRAGGGSGVGGDGVSDADGPADDCCCACDIECPIVGYVPLEADSAPPTLLIQLLSGYGSGFDESTSNDEADDVDSVTQQLALEAAGANTTPSPSDTVFGETSP